MHDAKPPQVTREDYSLSPAVTHLNHGSFGSSPRVVLEARRRWLDRLAEDPWDFLVNQAPDLLWDVRTKLGALVGTSAENLIFVDNATVGINIVARSFQLAPADEVLLCDHEYGAVQRIWRHHCAAVGARLVTITLPTPVASAASIVAAFAAAITPRTRLIVVSHITSPSATVFPVAEICALARQHGVAVCIDGPHAIGVLPVDIDRLGCDFYAASCHKWICAPVSTGFLYVHPRWQSRIEPLVTSWGNGNGRPADKSPGWQDEFYWMGTRDPSSWLALPTAMEFLERFGWERFRQQTHELVQYALQRLTKLPGVTPLTQTDELFGSMVAVQVPPGSGQALQKLLLGRDRIEIPSVEWQNKRLLRVSCHLYTTRQDIDRLVECLPAAFRDAT